MPIRYPSIQGYRNAGRKLGGFGSAVGGAIAGATLSGPELENTQPEPGATTTTGNGVNYPTFKRPGFWARMVDPAGARQIDSFNFQSQMAGAGDQAELGRMKAQTDQQVRFQREVRLLDSAKQTLERAGYTPEMIQDIIAASGNAAVNKAQFEQARSAQDLELASNEPKVLYENTKETLRQPGVQNAQVSAYTRAREIGNQYLPQQTELEIKEAENRNRALAQDTEHRGLRFPYEYEQLQNQTEQSGIVPLSPNNAYGNLPPDLNFQMFSPGVKAMPPRRQFNFDTGTMDDIPATSAEPPAFFDLGNLRNRQPGITQPPPPSSQGSSDTIVLPNGKVFRRRTY